MASPIFLYDNRLNDATPAASTTAAGDFNVLNLRDWRAYTWWKPTALPATVTVDCGSAKSADYCLVWGHDLFTQGATIEIRKSTDNFAANDVLVATLTPTTNKGFLLQFASTSARYWRIKITGTTMPAIAIAAVGAALTVPVVGLASFDAAGRAAQAQRNESVKGQPLGQVIDFEKFEESLEFQQVARSWIDSAWVPAWTAHLRSSPFGFAWDPARYPNDLFLVTADKEFAAPQLDGGNVHLKLKVFGVYP